MEKKREYGETAILDIQIDSSQTFKPLPVEYRYKSNELAIAKVCETLNLTYGITSGNGNVTAFIQYKDPNHVITDSEYSKILIELSKESFQTLNQVITEDGQNPKDYFRNVTLYESSKNPNNIILTWSKK